MTTEERIERIKGMIRDSNYVAAYTAIKESRLDELDRTELTGSMVAQIVDELSRCTKREDRERAVYLRTLLSWVFRDVPGLSALYREQLRLAHRSEGDFATGLYRNFRTMSDVAGGRKTIAEGFEETAENLRTGFEEAADNLRAGDPSESVKTFMNAAENTIKDGLEQFGRFFESLNQQTAGQREQHSERADDEATTSDTQDTQDTDGTPTEDEVQDVEFEEKE
ncbi:MAG: hypothetical protein EA383_16035 [Spirochaetaceae bacterium]|nr:MAG: hypothetical protein EA383_16035 [Spirochaetaceae bacterium]